jgi:hypothetical protein
MNADTWKKIKMNAGSYGLVCYATSRKIFRWITEWSQSNKSNCTSQPTVYGTIENEVAMVAASYGMAHHAHLLEKLRKRINKCASTIIYKTTA